MTHSDAGNYAAKHRDRELPEKLNIAVSAAAADNRLSCSKAHRIARDTGFSPEDVGRAADLIEVRLTACQLGLFGHGKKEKIKAAAAIDPELEKAMQNNLTGNELACAAAWAIADQFNLKKTDITAACEAAGIKIRPCQLGAF
jgi:hypothetical protein